MFYKKRWYTTYVRHYMKFYCRYPEPEFRRDADKPKWAACGKVLNRLSENEKSIVQFVFENKDTIEDNVFACSESMGLTQEEVYDTLIAVEEEVAREMELI